MKSSDFEWTNGSNERNRHFGKADLDSVDCGTEQNIYGYYSKVRKNHFFIYFFHPYALANAARWNNQLRLPSLGSQKNRTDFKSIKICQTTFYLLNRDILQNYEYIQFRLNGNHNFTWFSYLMGFSNLFRLILKKLFYVTPMWKSIFNLFICNSLFPTVIRKWQT